MNRPSRFWPALESAPGPAAVADLWRAWLGDEYELVRPLLRPTDCLAATYPRLHGADAGFPVYRVVEHGPEDFVGVCQETGVHIALTTSELLVYELDWLKFMHWLAPVLGVELAESHETFDVATRFVGRLRPLAGYTFPVYLTIPLEARHLRDVICQLLAAVTGPFLVVTPTQRRWQPLSEQLVQQRGAAYLCLADAFAVDASGQWAETGAAAPVLQSFLGRHLPASPPAASPVTFPTPPQARWGDLRLRFQDGHTVSARLLEVYQLLSFQEMGMADGRNSTPDQRWQLLRVLARTDGTVKPDKRPDAKTSHKPRQRLAQALKEFFRLPGEPFAKTDDGRGWKTVFQLEPEE